jgi:DNA-binding MarR family transcriptional regulator
MAGPAREFGDQRAHARRLIRDRRRREEVLGADIFGEPAWDLLLELYVAHAEDRPVSTLSACMAVSVSLTTGLHWLTNLEEHQLIERLHVGGDERLTLLLLTDSAFDRMTALLREMA